VRKASPARLACGTGPDWWSEPKTLPARPVWRRSRRHRTFGEGRHIRGTFRILEL
jgi:hypothetical protein